MYKIRTFLSESLKDEYKESKELEYNIKIPSSRASLQVRLMTDKIKTFLVEALRNYTHKSFITFFTVGLIFIVGMIIEFGRLACTTSTSTKPEVILVYYLGFVFAVCIFSLTSFLLFLFWEVLQHAIDRTSWEYNCVRVLFFVGDVITAVKWYSAAIQGRPDGINYILMAVYIKAGSLALLGFFFLTWCVYRQRKNKTFQSLLRLKFGVLLFLSIHVTSLMAFKHQSISWQTTAIVCSLFFLGFAICIMMCSRFSEEDTGLIMQIKITGLLMVLYVIIISLFFVVHYDMDCNDHCGQRTPTSTNIPIKQSLDTLDTPKIVDGDLKEEMTCKINQTRGNGNDKKGGRLSYLLKAPTSRTGDQAVLDTPKIFDGDFTVLKEEMTCKINQTRGDGNNKIDGRLSYLLKTQTLITT